MTKILVVTYSQTGQLERVVNPIIGPLQRMHELDVHIERLKPSPDYAFPWSFWSIANVFPEAARGVPTSLKPLDIDPSLDFDLIILGYTVWYLSPSPPMTSFLTSQESKRLLNGKPVITVVACRDMWLMAQQSMRQLLQQAGAFLSDHVAFVDQGAGPASFVTTPRWMLTGRTDRLWGIFPPAGVAEKDIDDARRFGLAIAQAVRENRLQDRLPLLSGLVAAKVDESLIVPEKAGRRSLRLWGWLAMKAGQIGKPLRVAVILVYALLFLTMIGIVFPLWRLLFRIFRPFFKNRLSASRACFEQPSGSGMDRMSEFSN